MSNWNWNFECQYHPFSWISCKKHLIANTNPTLIFFFNTIAIFRFVACFSFKVEIFLKLIIRSFRLHSMVAICSIFELVSSNGAPITSTKTCAWTPAPKCLIFLINKTVPKLWMSWLIQLKYAKDNNSFYNKGSNHVNH